MRTPKLVIGKMNLVIKKGRTVKAKGCEMSKGWDAMQGPKPVEAFNTPTICITLRKAA